MLLSILAISAGASTGAVMRWLLGLALNHLFPVFPLGTLTANLIGGYCIGLGIGFFDFFSHLAPEWRLMAVTGFLGGLTTFSAFSAEMAGLIHSGRYGWAGVAIALHVGGSIAMTFLGIGTFALFKPAA